MKSVIVDIRGKYAAALSEDGCVIKVRNHNYAIGQEIEIKVGISKKKVAVFAAGAAAVLALCGIGGYTYYSPYSYVSIDINPSIEFTLNRFDRVLQAKGTNDDGDMILTRVELENLSNKSIGEAIAITVAEISELGYFNGDEESGIVIATSAKDPRKADKLASELKDTINKELNDENLVVYDENKDDDNRPQNDAQMGADDIISDKPGDKKKEDPGNTSGDDNNNNGENGKAITVEVISVVKERVELAKELGVTPGKLHLVEKLQQYADGYEAIDVEEWLKKPVKEIMKATKDFKNALKNRQAETLSEDENETADDTKQSEGSAGDSTERTKSDKNGNGKNNKGSKKDKDAASGKTIGSKDDDRDHDRDSKPDKNGNNSSKRNGSGSRNNENDNSNDRGKDKDKDNNSNSSNSKDKGNRNGNGKSNSGWKVKGSRKRP